MSLVGLNKITLSKTRRFQLIYFIYFISVSGFALFRNVYLEEIGMTGIQMGTIGFALIIAGAIAQPLWGFISDRAGIPKVILVVGATISGIAILSYPISGIFTNPFLLLLTGSVMFAIFRSPIVPITNSLILSNNLRYGSIRAFASIAFGIGGLLVGVILYWFNTVLIIYLYLLGVAVVVLLIQGLSIPETDISQDWGTEVFQLVKDFDYRLLLTTAFIMGMIIFPGEVFFSVYMREIGLSDSLTGVAFGIVNITEAAIFIHISRFDLRYNWMIVFGASCYVASYIVFAMTTSPVVILVIHFVLGFGFPFFYFGAVNIAHKIAPATLSSTSQAFLSAIGLGAGNAVGQIFAGYLIDFVGIREMYLYLAGIATIGILLGAIIRPSNK